MMNRRTFLVAGGVALGAAAAWRSRTIGANAQPSGATDDAPDRLGVIGVQLFSLPKMLEQDLDGTLAMLAELGYGEVELYGPYGFSTPAAIESWQAMGARLGFTASGTYGRTPTEFRAILGRHGLKATSAHIELATLIERPDQVGEAAQALGLSHLGISNIPPEYRKTLDDYKRMADRFNEMGEKARPYGFKMLYHNHGYGFAPMEGQIPVRVLLDRVNPAVFAAEMDLFWTTAAGVDPVELLTAYPKVYRLLHIKDMSERARFAGDGGDASQWMALFPKMTTAGNGVLELPKILSAAKRIGVEHYLVEQDLVANPREALGASLRYLKGLELT